MVSIIWIPNNSNYSVQLWAKVYLKSRLVSTFFFVHSILLLLVNNYALLFYFKHQYKIILEGCFYHTCIPMHSNLWFYIDCKKMAISYHTRVGTNLNILWSCLLSHLYIMPVKQGYKIDGRDQTHRTKTKTNRRVKNKRNTFVTIFSFSLSWSKIILLWLEWNIICLYQQNIPLTVTISQYYYHYY